MGPFWVGVPVVILAPVSFCSALIQVDRELNPWCGWPGIKVAKLEIKMIVVLMLVRYEYTVVDAVGKPPRQLPKPNRNDIHQVCLSFPLSIDAVLTYSSSAGKTNRRNLFSSVQKVT